MSSTHDHVAGRQLDCHHTCFFPETVEGGKFAGATSCVLLGADASSCVMKINIVLLGHGMGGWSRFLGHGHNHPLIADGASCAISRWCKQRRGPGDGCGPVATARCYECYRPIWLYSRTWRWASTSCMRERERESIYHGPLSRADAPCVRRRPDAGSSDSTVD